MSSETILAEEVSAVLLILVITSKLSNAFTTGTSFRQEGWQQSREFLEKY